MNNDYLDVENAIGMPDLMDSTIALDFLLTLKSEIRNFAVALTEIADSEARMAVRSLLDNSIDMHAQVSEFMINKGWLHPYNLDQQIQIDTTSAKTAVQIAGLQLFPGYTGRLGTFATPQQ